MDVPAYTKPLIVTDAAINIQPTLDQKRDICQNAIDFLRQLGTPEPLVAILAAVETVDPQMPATLDAAALAVMARRGQITGALVDGPLAFDNAISLTAAQIKEIVSPVAGRADILVVPDLEAGNMLAKSLSFLAGADAGDIKARTAAWKAEVTFRELGSILGIFMDMADKKSGAVQALLDIVVEMRRQARQQKDYSLADSIRDFLAQMQVKIEDGPEGSRIRYEEAPALDDIMEYIIKVRQDFKMNKQYERADWLRERLKDNNIILEDTREGARWKFVDA